MTKTNERKNYKIKGKIYPYMKIKKQINVNLHKNVLEKMDEMRKEVFEIYDEPSTRSTFIQRALINYFAYLDKIRAKGD